MYNTILLVWYSWIPALLCHVYYIQGKINQLLNFIKSLSNHCMVIDHFRHFNLQGMYTELIGAQLKQMGLAGP